MPTQSLQVIGFSKEVTAGTFVAPTHFIPGIATPNSSLTVVRPTQSRGTRSQVIDEPTAFTTGIQVSAELIPEVLSYLIAGWFGTGSDAVTNSGAAYTHTLTPQNSVPTYSFEVDSDIYTQVLARQFLSNVVDQLALTYQAGQITTLQTTTLATKEQTPVTPGLPSNPTPSISTLTPMDFSLLATTVGGSSSVQMISATLTLSNQSQYVVCANGTIFPQRIQATQRNITLSTTLDFIDASWYTYYQNEYTSRTGFIAAGGLVLTLQTIIDIPTTSTPYKVQFTIPNLRPQDQYGLTAASDVLQQQMTWSITEGAGGNEISAVIVNSESATLA